MLCMANKSQVILIHALNIATVRLWSWNASIIVTTAADFAVFEVQSFCYGGGCQTYSRMTLCKSTQHSAIPYTQLVQGDVQRDENKKFNSAIMRPIQKEM